MPIFDQKTVNSVKTTLYCGSKKSKDALSFFPIFHGKNTSLLCPYFVKKTSTLEKIHCSQVHILSKNVQSLKNTVLWCQFFKFFTKNSLLSSPYLVKKRQFCQNYAKLWAQQVKKMSFFFDFSQNNSSYVNILSKKRPFSKKHTVLMPIFCQKKPNSLKKLCSHFNFFFQIKMKNLLLSYPYLD